MDYLVSVGSDRREGQLRPEHVVARAVWQLGAVGLPVKTVSGLYACPDPDGNGPASCLVVALVTSERGAAHVFDAARRVEAATAQDSLWVRPLAGAAGYHPDEVTWARAADGQDVGRDLLPDPEVHRDARLLTALAEVAPTWRHPRKHATAAELLAALPQRTVSLMGALPDAGERWDVAE